MENTDNHKYIEIGSRIKEIREKEGMTQGELAKILGYSSPTAISLFEAGDRKIRIDDLEKIAQIFHRDINYFIHGDSTYTKPNLKLALRADDGLDQDDVNKVESFIDALKLLKKQGNGRHNNSK